MAKRQLIWTMAEDNSHMSCKSVDNESITTDFVFDDIIDYEPITHKVSFHLFRHGLKQILADTVAGAKDATIEEKFDIMNAKWNDICNGKLTSRKAKAPKVTKKQAIEKLGDDATPEQLAMIDLLFG